MKKYDFAFLGNPVAPHSEKRYDGIIDEMSQNRQARLVGFCGDQLVIKSAGEKRDVFLTQALFPALNPDWKNAFYLGLDNGKPILTAPVLIEPSQLRPPFALTNLRNVWTNNLIPVEQTGVLAQAASLFNWHKNNRFCARCGQETKIFGGGVKRVCALCGAEHFPRVDPVAIMLVHYNDKCLLARTSQYEQGRYTCLSGFIEPGETLEAAVRRETFEEMGVKVGEVSYLASQPWPFPHSLMFGCFAEALAQDITIDRDEMEDGRWFSRDEVTAMMTGHHPNGFTLPPAGAIAHFLIREWLEQK